MPQMHFYVSEDIAEEIQRRAEASGLPVSRYLADLVKREIHPGWTQEYKDEVLGGWAGGPLVRPDQGEFEQRQAW